MSSQPGLVELLREIIKHDYLRVPCKAPLHELVKKYVFCGALQGTE